MDGRRHQQGTVSHPWIAVHWVDLVQNLDTNLLMVLRILWGMVGGIPPILELVFLFYLVVEQPE